MLDSNKLIVNGDAWANQHGSCWQMSKCMSMKACDKNDAFGVTNKRALQSLRQMAQARNKELSGEHWWVEQQHHDERLLCHLHECLLQHMVLHDLDHSSLIIHLFVEKLYYQFYSSVSNPVFMHSLQHIEKAMIYVHFILFTQTYVFPVGDMCGMKGIPPTWSLGQLFNYAILS